MDTDIKALIAARRAAIKEEIQRLQLKLELLDELFTSAKVQPALRLNGAEPPPKRLSPSLKATAVTLATFKNGMSANELAALETLPIGTASSRLSNLKNAGLARLEDHRYFAVHSTPQDTHLA
jgi:hypothetical protein